MKLKRVYIITIVIMLICNILLSLHIRKEGTITEDINTIKQMLIEKRHLNYVLYESIDCPITNPYIYLGSCKDSLNINELIDSPKLIFRYSTMMCQPCIEEVISALQEVFPDYRTNNDILFSCKNLEERLKESHLEKINITFISMNNIPIEKHEIPYFFILDHDLKIKNLYPILKNSKQEIVDYLSIIKEREQIY